MKKIIAFLLIVLFSAAAFCQEAQVKADFRKASWGMTRDEVSLSEGLELVPWVVGLYKLDSVETILGMQAVVFYSFYQGKLAYAGYEFGKNSNSAYDAVGEKLQDKYGEAEYFDERIWLESHFFLAKANFKEDCAKGKMRWESKWPLGDTTIYLRQEANGDGGIRIRIYYLSKDYELALQGGASDQDKL